MKVILAEPRGFCAGVQRAVDILDLVLELHRPPVYVKHEIVHNKHVVGSFRNRGVVFVESCAEVPEGSVIVMSAHGVSPAIRQEASERQLKVIDATCPLVTKVHLEAQRFHKQGYTIIYLCHKNHPEAQGVMGEVPTSIIFPVETIEDIGTLPPDLDSKPCALLTQTTLSVQETQGMIEELLRRFPHLILPAKEDICYATTNRQHAVEQLVRKVDMIIVLGSKQSSNSTRLAEVARRRGVASYLIDGAEYLHTLPIEETSVIGLTSGASAPEKLVQDCVQYFRKRGAEVETLKTREEDVRFTLPSDLIRAARAKNTPSHHILSRHKP